MSNDMSGGQKECIYLHRHIVHTDMHNIINNATATVKLLQELDYPVGVNLLLTADEN